MFVVVDTKSMLNLQNYHSRCEGDTCCPARFLHVIQRMEATNVRVDLDDRVITYL
jgi:hypothetical protein